MRVVEKLLKTTRARSAALLMLQNAFNSACWKVLIARGVPAPYLINILLHKEENRKMKESSSENPILFFFSFHLRP